MDHMDELAATLNGHQVTDDEGNIAESETADGLASTEQTTNDETATAESAEVEDVEQTNSSTSESQTDLAEDELGKRYVPESRFKEVYAKMKQLERERIAQPSPIQTTSVQHTPQALDKTEMLEIEILKGKMPQFDPGSSEYSPEIDELGGYILKANPGMSRIEAARRAVEHVKKLSLKEAVIKSEARSVKSLQSDQGISARVVSRGETRIDPEKMTLEEMESYLKMNGSW